MDKLAARDHRNPRAPATSSLVGDSSQTVRHCLSKTEPSSQEPRTKLFRTLEDAGGMWAGGDAERRRGIVALSNVLGGAMDILGAYYFVIRTLTISRVKRTAMYCPVSLSPLRLLAVDETLGDPSAPIQQQNHRCHAAGITGVRYAASQIAATPLDLKRLYHVYLSSHRPGSPEFAYLVNTPYRRDRQYLQEPNLPWSQPSTYHWVRLGGVEQLPGTE